MRDTAHQYAFDTRNSEELVEVYRKYLESDEDYCEELAILHFRGGKREYDIGKRLSESEDPLDRAIGADILAQLGWSDRTFQDESVDILTRLLKDNDPNVLYSTAIALGHRNDPRAIPYLIELADHHDSDIRYGVVLGLSGHDDKSAMSALIKLSRDSNKEVRNWATFGLGAQTEMDSPEIRDALISALDDQDSEIRGEALVGLALRKDPCVVNALIEEWKDEYIGSLSIEAAEEIADPELIPHLKNLFKRLDLSDDEEFENLLIQAIVSCEEKGSGN